MSFVSYNDRKAVATALKTVYATVAAVAAESALSEFRNRNLAKRYKNQLAIMFEDRFPTASQKRQAQIYAWSQRVQSIDLIFVLRLRFQRVICAVDIDPHIVAV